MESSIVEIEGYLEALPGRHGIDLDPDVLHGEHAAMRPRLLREYRLERTG